MAEHDDDSDYESWAIEQIEAGIRDADAGRFVSHEKVVAWLKTWGTKDETKAPLSD